MAFEVITEETPGTVSLPVAPSSIWVISTLEIAVRCDEKVSMLLHLSSYALDNQENAPAHDEGYWAPPFVAYPVPLTYSPPTSVGSLRAMCKRHISGIDIEDDLGHLAYQLGLRDISLKSRSSFIELKTSPRSPGLVKAYYFVRHALVGVSPECLRNLSDPECRRGYVYLPLDAIDAGAKGIRAVTSVTHGRVEQWFLGKPLQSNVEHVIASRDRRAQLESRALEVPLGAFMREESGLLMACDLRAYGSVVQHAKQSMSGFLGTGEDAATYFSRSVAVRLQEFLVELGLTQVQVAGDGLVAALPSRLGEDLDRSVARVSIAWMGVIAFLQDMNARLYDEALHVGSRIALHFGGYTYGRVAGPTSAAASFDGESVVEVVRLEQGLADIARGSGSEMPGHVAVVSARLGGLLEGRWPQGWTALAEREVQAKEYQARATILGITPSGGLS